MEVENSDSKRFIMMSNLKYDGIPCIDGGSWLNDGALPIHGTYIPKPTGGPHQRRGFTPSMMVRGLAVGDKIYNFT